MKNPAIPTLEDVARIARVSTATVSRCLNEKDKVTKATRDRVMTAVDALGYAPNFNARAMAARRSYTIGAIIPTMENAIFAKGLQAFQEQLHKAGYNLMVSSSAYDPTREADQIKTMVAGGLDGLLLIGHSRESKVYEYLNNRAVPFVLAWSMNTHLSYISVGFDNRTSMKLLADKALSLGHTQIAVISGITAGNDRAQSRLDGIRDSMRTHGLPLSPSQVIEAPYDILHGATAFETLMERDPRTTLIMCGNDVLAVGALSKARELGFRVPLDVSVTGFDDIELARHVTPTLTTVHVPHGEMGVQAANVLTQMIDGSVAPSSVPLDTHIVDRQSLAPPR